MYVKFTSRKRSKLNDVRLRWCSPTAKEQLFLSSSQPQLLSVFPPPPSSPSVMLLWNTLQLEIFMASFPLYVRGAAVVGQGSVSIWWDQMSSTCISTQTPQGCWVWARFWEELQLQTHKRLWVSPVALQCVTGLLFSFKFFWNACKL